MEREVGSQVALEPSCPTGTHRSYRCSPSSNCPPRAPAEPRPRLSPGKRSQGHSGYRMSHRPSRFAWRSNRGTAVRTSSNVPCASKRPRSR